MFGLAIDVLNFIRPITLGQLVEYDARLVFTSAKSMVIKVDAFAVDIITAETYSHFLQRLVVEFLFQVSCCHGEFCLRRFGR